MCVCDFATPPPNPHQNPKQKKDITESVQTLKVLKSVREGNREKPLGDNIEQRNTKKRKKRKGGKVSKRATQRQKWTQRERMGGGGKGVMRKK